MMHRQLVVFSVMSLALVGGSAGLAVANSADGKLDETLCFLRNQQHQQQDLTKICGKSVPVAAPSQLDPKAPVNFNMPRSRTPSALWNTVPDSDVPIELGKTYTPVPTPGVKPVPQPAAPSQAPVGDDDSADE